MYSKCSSTLLFKILILSLHGKGLDVNIFYLTNTFIAIQTELPKGAIIKMCRRFQISAKLIEEL